MSAAGGDSSGTTANVGDEDAAPDGPRTERDRRRERKMRWAVRLGLVVLRVVGVTWRYRFRNRAPSDALHAAGRPFIYAFWHGQLLPLLWAHRGKGVTVLISAHRDGEIVARVAHALGYRTVRGSTTRGGARALLEMVSELERGTAMAVTPDGPRGPAERFQPGALVAAQRSGAPIVPVAVSVSRAWRLRSWDRFVIPKPFARVAVAYGNPESVRAGSARDAPAEAGRFEALLSELAATAARPAG